MEPDRQVEIQLGHMCNNRCVFCVSGQRTALGEALPMPVEPFMERVRTARAEGHRKITLLGGEPTLQPGFMQLLQECVDLGYEEIVLFTNGSKTARAAVVDEVLATGGNITWRISVQGATPEAHERTTGKPGSFERILRTLGHLRDRKQRITANMCVVTTNFESIDRFPALLLPFGVSQLHLDMMRPLDAGQRTEAELRGLIPRHADLIGPLTRMVRGFPDGFDVNVGNVPFCAAPELARWIHHDGEHTDTIDVNGAGEISEPWNKYEVKRRDKGKPDRCADCLFDSRCSGIFQTYKEFYGDAELVPITAERLRRADPGRHFLALHLRDAVQQIPGWEAEEKGVEEVHLRARGVTGLVVALRSERHGGGIARFDGFTVHVTRRPQASTEAIEAVRALGVALRDGGLRVIHPLGDDALGVTARSIAVRLARLRAAAPFGALDWAETTLSADGSRAELSLMGPTGERATFWLGEDGRRATGGYEVQAAVEPSPALVAGLRALMEALAGRTVRAVAKSGMTGAR